MTIECPVCKQKDIIDGALKCHHCGSWIDDGKRLDDYERTRAQAEAQLKSDFEQHKKTLDGAMATLKWVGTAVVVAVAGVSAYFGYRTDSSITEISEKITSQAATKLDEKIGEATDDAIDRVDATVRERMDSPEMREQIDTTIQGVLEETVDAAVEGQFDEVNERVTDQLDVANSTVELAIDGIEVRANAAVQEASELLDGLRSFADEARVVVADVEGLNASVNEAQSAQVAQADGVLDFQALNAEGKGDLSLLDELVAERVNALRFEVGSFYVASFLWKYFDRLQQVTEFRYAVLYENERPLGYWQADRLMAALNPENNVVVARFNADSLSLPDDQEVPGWSEFAQMLEQREVDALRGLAGFTPMDRSVSADASNLEVLEIMQRSGAETLPVRRGEGGDLAGIVDRSRLTTRVLLEIAGRRGD